MRGFFVLRQGVLAARWKRGLTPVIQGLFPVKHERDLRRLGELLWLYWLLTFLTRIFHELLSRDREDGRATWQPSRAIAGLVPRRT